jgi:WD40 repeat protein
MAVRKKSFFLIPVLLLSLAALVFAEGTLTWKQSKFDELSKGTAEGVAIRSTGGLELAPAFKALTTTPSTYIWGIASDHAGNVYAAAGAPARVYRISPEGKSTAIFGPQELQVQALAVDDQGDVYAATNPDGKIYRIRHPGASGEHNAKSADGSWSASVFFDPHTKYIWDVVLDRDGNLYVATGDHGEIFRVTPSGQSSMFFKSDDAHIRVLALDHQGNLIAGSDGSGLIYRITPQGKAFVLYSAPKKEITALAIDPAGDIYAAAAGEKNANPNTLVPSMPIQMAAPRNPAQAGQTGITISAPAAQPAVVIGNVPEQGAVAGGSEIYKIAPDGSPDSIWSSPQELVYALAFDHDGRLLAGTGNHGHIFAISDDGNFTDLLQASASQVTAFAKAPDGGIYACTSNLGKIFLLGAGPATQGKFESDIFDAHIFSRWGRLEYRGTGNIDLFARTGNVDNPDRNWSSWQKIDPQAENQIHSPSARFIQWKAVLHAGNPAPSLDSVTVNYLPKNVAPAFDGVSVQLGVRYQPSPQPQGGVRGVANDGQQNFDAPPPTVRDPGSIGVKWAVHDDNNDQMVYSIYYKGDGEARWLLLKDGITDKFYSFDASLLPDGGYKIKVMASDGPSHSPGHGLTAEDESSRFEVDTTPPRIEELTASIEGGRIHISFKAKDDFSNIKRAEFSVDAQDWQYIAPVGQLSDSKTESYDFSVPVPAADASHQTNAGSSAKDSVEHVVVVRAYDKYDNMGAAKTVIR